MDQPPNSLMKYVEIYSCKMSMGLVLCNQFQCSEDERMQLQPWGPRSTAHFLATLLPGLERIKSSGKRNPQAFQTMEIWHEARNLWRALHWRTPGNLHRRRAGEDEKKHEKAEVSFTSETMRCKNNELWKAPQHTCHDLN